MAGKSMTYCFESFVIEIVVFPDCIIVDSQGELLSELRQSFLYEFMLTFIISVSRPCRHRQSIEVGWINHLFGHDRKGLSTWTGVRKPVKWGKSQSSHLGPTATESSSDTVE